MALPPPDPVYTIRGSMSCAHSLFYSKDGNLLYVGTSEGFVHVWDLRSFRELKKIKVGSESCLCVDSSKGYFFTQEKGRDVKIWDSTDWRLLRTIAVDYIGFCKVQLHDEFIICPGNDSKISIHFLESEFVRELVHPPEPRVGQVMCIKYLEHLDAILVAYEAGYISLWDRPNTRLISEISLSLGSDCPMALDYSERANSGVLGTSSEKIFKFAVEDGNIRLVCQTALTNPGVSSISIHPEENICVIGCWDGKIRYFSMKKLRLLSVLDHHNGSIECVLFSQQKLKSTGSITLAAAGKDGRVSLWTLYN